jgi:hypothetical protein
VCLKKLWSWSLEKWGGPGPQGAVEPLEKNYLFVPVLLQVTRSLQWLSYESGFDIPAGAGFSIHTVSTVFGDHQASYVLGNGAFFSLGKATRSETDRLPPSSADVKNAWSYTFI